MPIQTKGALKMPSAGDWERDRYRTMFPDIGAEHGVKFLEDRGFKLTKDFEWLHPPERLANEEELFVIQFLCNEWDFGWIVPKHWENEVRDANRS
jgi:hypothetical protein